MNLWELQFFQALPLEVKTRKSVLRIQNWYEHFNGDVYVHFTGSKDSTVLLDLVRSEFPDVPAVYVDTGMDFPETRQYVETIPNVTWLKPRMDFRDVIARHGYPVVSKTQSRALRRKQKNAALSCAECHISKRWNHLTLAPFLISPKCCAIMRDEPLARYGKETGRVPYTSMLASESALFTRQWLKCGCNKFDGRNPRSTPIAFWTADDVWTYIGEHDLPHSGAYGLGCQQAGCIFCTYGVHLEAEPNRFQQMQNTHPELWLEAMRDCDEGGLGLRPVLECLGVPYKNSEE